ncbi:MAG: thioesterase [Spirochaetes bacterium GWB1_59_5]|nr:MAG: thioesterase [Spirochaetes bacterium GWB1_59_5]
MARIRVELPETFQFSTEIEVTIGHINYGGHVGNDSMLTIVHEARIRYLESLGYSEKDVEGSGLILSDAAIEYKAECFRGDRLTIQVAVADPGKYGCDLCYLVTKTGTEIIAARVKTGVLFFDYGTRRPVSIPENFKVKTGLV